MRPVLCTLGATAAIASVFFAACSSASAPAAPSVVPAATRDGRFQQDIDALAETLPRLHANLFFRTPREEFDRQVAAVRTRVAELQDHEIVSELIRLAALPGDAHTAISPFGYRGFRRLPLQARLLSDGILVVAARDAAEGLLGGRIVRIDDTAIDEAIEKVAPLVSRDNDAWLRAIVTNYLLIPEILHARGVSRSPDRATITVVLPAGNTVAAEVRAIDAGQENTYKALVTAPPPLYRQRASENYWFTRTDSDVLYLQYNRCQEAASDPMSGFASRVFAEVDRVPPRAFVIDLRANGGGNSAVADPLFAGLRARRYLAQSGRLFVLIGNATFSSALLNAITLKRDLGAILVGEPTGGRPNGYGEVKTFALPNTALNVSYSTKFFRSWPDGDPESLMPDVPSSISSVDYVEGRDPAFGAILSRLGLVVR